MMNHLMALAGAATLAMAGTAMAQTTDTDSQHALGSSMGTQADATPRSRSASVASGAHHTPVAKAGRRHGYKASGSLKAGSTSGSGDVSASHNANPTNQH